jgi:glycosyltransferase involved in cell wall biosynthesis
VIDVKHPDYTNAPASDTRPVYSYQPREEAAPSLSIITPYYNTGPVFLETARAIARMSFTHWEWLIVDDGSTQAESLAQLARVAAAEPRIRVIRQANGGPAVARNRAAREARGRYLLQVDSDDLMEPTFAEKAIWFLETQPQFAACNSYNVTFGSKNFLWPHGFQEYEKNIDNNHMTMQAVIRKEDYFRAGGYDESIDCLHEDWDFWLNLAEIGLWGFSLPEYLTWYRTQEKSRRVEIETDKAKAQAFHDWLRRKHSGLAKRFPHPRWESNMDVAHAKVSDQILVMNPLLKPEGKKRILLLAPWLEMGGADKFNLDLIRLLSQRGYEFTLATTLEADDSWKSLFTAVTPDVFCLSRFLNRPDYPRFIDYLIESRQIDAVLISNCELAYLLLPYLRAHHPDLPLLDYNHLEEEQWKAGGYPAMSVRAGRHIDLNVTCTDHLKQWMVARGADPDRIEVVHCNVDTKEWSPEGHDALAIRQRLGISADLPLILFVGRIIEQKRPLVFAKIIQELAAQEPRFLALVVGTGPDIGALKAFVSRHKLEQHIRFMGALPNSEVRQLMAAGDILLLPSEREGLALVLYEAMAMQMVPVAAAVGGHAELVTPACGYLIPHGETEVAAYTAALLDLLRHPEQRKQMGQQARQRVVEHFDIQQFIEGMENVLTRTCQLAKRCPAKHVDLELAGYTAHMAVEYTRIQEVADALWSQREKYAWSHRPLKRRILPFGSRRHEAYKRVRWQVEHMLHRRP